MSSYPEKDNAVGAQQLLHAEEENDTNLRAEDTASEEDSNDEDNDGHCQVQQTSGSVANLLKMVLEEISKGAVDLADNAHLASFESKWLHDLVNARGDKYLPTVLHMLVMNDKEADLPSIPDNQMKILVSSLVKHDRNLMTRGNCDGKTPLYQAIDHRKETMVQWMFEAHPDIDSIISKPSDLNSQLYLHMAVKRKLKYFAKMAQQVDGKTLALRDSKGNTVLHLLVEHKRCRKGQLAIIEDVIARSDVIIANTPDGDFNNAGYSPYLCHKRTVQNAAKAALGDQSKTSATGEGSGIDKTCSAKSKNDRASSGGERVSDYIADDSFSGAPTQSGPHQDPARDARAKVNAQPNTRAKYNGPSVSRPQPNSDRTCVEGCPTAKVLSTSPYAADDSGSSAKLRSNWKSEETPSSNKRSKVDEQVVKDVERFLKLHYLRSRTDSACMDILYGKDSVTDLELFFDLSGRSSMTLSGFTALVKQLNFEDALQYVAIPAIKIESAGGESTSKQRFRDRSANDGTGRRDLVQVFDGLRKKGVKTILKVIVDDTLSPPHTDEAIEQALCNLDVEVWDWAKIDLCSEVIFNAAPRVREVHLYWGGNNAVLRGWSDEGGLKVLTELRTVWLHYQKGIESTKRTKQYVKDFEERLNKLDFNHGPVKLIKNQLEEYGRHSPGAQRVRGVKTRHAWIDCMKKFRGILFNVEHLLTSEHPPLVPSLIEEPIKVALIDDGADFMELDYPLAGGRSFCSRDKANHLNHPYYASATGQGTVMAKLINFMCPRTQLYVFRLDYQPTEGGRRINARSAAQAITAAVRRGVDIISMSWTIDTPEDEEVKTELDQAILEADKANILMFCSAADQGAKTSDTYPSRATRRIFTIGAAGPYGETISFVGDPQKIDFTFPGDKVEIMDGVSTTAAVSASSPTSAGGSTTNLVTGSWVATALAAGFAALVLYCVQVKLFCAQSEKDKAQVRQDFHALKTYEEMKRAFQKTIGTSPESKYKFITVWELFGNAVEQRDWADPEQLIDLVAGIGMRLCTGVTVRIREEQDENTCRQ